MYPLSNITLDYRNVDCTQKGLNMIHSSFEGAENEVVNRSSSETVDQFSSCLFAGAEGLSWAASIMASAS